jgi:hypothetical protein
VITPTPDCMKEPNQPEIHAVGDIMDSPMSTGHVNFLWFMGRRQVMKRFAFFVLSMCAATSAYAGLSAVPEIDGIAGLTALGAVGATMAFIWERRRRKAK